MEYKPENNKRTRGWTINKQLNVGDLLTLVLAAFAVITAYYALDKRITVIETTQQYNIQQVSRDRDEIKASMNRLEEKLDKLLTKERVRHD